MLNKCAATGPWTAFRCSCKHGADHKMWYVRIQIRPGGYAERVLERSDVVLGDRQSGEKSYGPSLRKHASVGGQDTRVSGAKRPGLAACVLLVAGSRQLLAYHPAQYTMGGQRTAHLG